MNSFLQIQASKTLPDNFTLFHTLNLANRKLMIGMNVVGVILLFIFGWLFVGIAVALNPEFFWLEMQILARTLSLPAFLLTMVLIIVLHELCHALFFWLFSRERPKIGFNFLYAYAAAPDWYFPRNQFVLIGLAPVLLLTWVGVVAMPFVHFAIMPHIILALTINAAGAIGDFIVVMWVLGQPANILLRDEGTVISGYLGNVSNSEK
jgi:hypothetical protein